VVTITTDNRTEITRYEYGADGIRTSAEHEIYIDGELQSKIRTEYLNDSKSLTGYSQVLRQTEYDANGNIIKTISYIIGHQRISQTVEIGGEKTTYYFTFDGHGSTRALLDLAGAIVQLYSFDAYGNALGFNSSEALTEFLYSGEQFDSKIGQQYLRQRYYDPTTGRFNQLDPFFGNLNDPLSLHKYLYTHGDPVNGIDPTGEFFGYFFTLFARGQSIAATMATGARTSMQMLYSNARYQRMLFYYLLASEAGVVTFWNLQGRLTAELAATYAMRGFLGLMILPQLVTRVDDAKHFIDDGIVLNGSDKERNKWMLQYALDHGAKVGDGNFYSFDINSWVNTYKNPNICSSYWIGYIQSFFVKGHYEIKITRRMTDNLNSPAYTFSIKNVNLHWAAGDEVDAHEPWHPMRETTWRGWIAESAVWLVGDTLLDANYRHWIHVFQDETVQQDGISVTLD
jgi:RHS repeat-associated protein